MRCITEGCRSARFSQAAHCKSCRVRHALNKLKWCNKCVKLLPLNNFHKDLSTPDKLYRKCKACRSCAVPCNHVGCSLSSHCSSAYCVVHLSQYRAHRGGHNLSDDEKRAYLAATGSLCCVCHGLMLWRDADIKALVAWAEDNDRPYHNHPRYATVEHLVAYSNAPHLERKRANMGMSHRSCNKGHASFEERKLARLTELMASDDVKVEFMRVPPVTFADVEKGL